jgi:hypothetical protein
MYSLKILNNMGLIDLEVLFDDSHECTNKLPLLACDVFFT